ncbi:MAG: protein kinase [Actinomycetota bacterium]
MTTSAADPVGAGKILGERYLMRALEWHTPLGPMWSARDRVLDRTVFVQTLAGPLAANAAARRAFQKSAARIAQITHPGILQVFDIGDDPSFVVYECAGGGRLSDRLRAGPMRSGDAARAALALARALEAMHERGEFHGTLSPDEILFDEEGRAKILAGGTADTARATRVAPANARPGVKAVEQVAAQPASYRPPEGADDPATADRYALAAVTFEMFTGKAPSAGRSARMERRSVPQAVDDLLRRALSPAPAERPTLDEFDGALAPYARVVPSDAREPRFSTGELRWLLPVVVIVVIGALAATLGVNLAKELTRPSKPKASSPATSAGGALLPVKTVVDFDPLGNNEEDPNDVQDAIDGNPATSWRTQCYAQASFGKPGVGLRFDLGTVRTIRSVRVQTDQPGWTAEIRIGNDASDKPAGYRVVKTFTAELDQRLALPGGSVGEYALLWVTRAAPYEGKCSFPFRASVSDVAFYA